MAKLILENTNFDNLDHQEKIFFINLLNYNSIKFKNYIILSFEIKNSPKKIFDNIMLNNYEKNGIFKGSRKNIFDFYIKNPCSAFLCGSQNYNITITDNTDFDFTVVSEENIKIQTDETESYFRIFNPSTLYLNAQNGDRIAWEYLISNNQVVKNDEIDKLRIEIKKYLIKKKIPWRKASYNYFNKWYPYFFLNKEEQPYSDIKRCVEKKGWPYKLGYYIFIDSVFSFYAEKNNEYSMDLNNFHLKEFTTRLKVGDILFNEWASEVIKYLPHQCNLYIDKKLPKIQ